ncbi:MAG: glycosyltransferase family A protein [Cyclobacteriaceae bacterium]
MISFVIPVKNGAKYLHGALGPFLSLDANIDWELVIVDDHSTDDTRILIEQNQAKTDRIKYFLNIGKGKVEALNYGYSKSTGRVIKFIDADDILTKGFFEHLNELELYDAHCHDAFVVTEGLRSIGRYNVNPDILNREYSYVLQNIVAIPRWSWSMKREIANRVFPIPEELPFEDVWFSLVIKLNARNILHIKKPCYLYRQHSNQTYGGVLNYSKKALNFRANRLLVLIEAFENHQDKLNIKSNDNFVYIKSYYSLLKSNFDLFDMVTSPLSFKHKVRVILISFFPRLAKVATIAKWKLDGL